MTEKESRDSISLLYDKYYPLFHKKAATFTDDQSEVEDILHDSFVKVLLRKEQIADMLLNEQISYVCTVITNTGIDYLKYKSRYVFVSEDLLDDIPDDIDVSPEEVLAVNEDKELSLKCFYKLNVKDRALIHLYYYEEYDAAKIAKCLHIKRKYIHQYIYNAKKRLAQLVKKELKSYEK